MSILKLKDSQGNWIGVPTIKGDRGNGISSAVLNNDYTLTLTFTDGTTYTTPSIRGEKGEQGDPASSMNIHICSSNEYDSETRIPTITNPDDKTFYLVPIVDGTSPDLFTEWVYVNNAWEMFGSASVDLTDYVKNTDYANSNKAGIVKVNNMTDGLAMNPQGDGTLVLANANSILIKAGSNVSRPIAPSKQHESAFYGLAKASGHDEKDSALPVGQYTDEAKASIQNMLDVPSNSELKEIKDSKADVIVESASGDIVSFSDGADNMPLQSLVVDINPVQDLHGYDSPWVAGGGKNLLDPTLLKDQVGWNVINLQLKPSTQYVMSTNIDNLSAMPIYFTNDSTQGSGSKVYSGHPVVKTSTEEGIIQVIQRRVSGEDSFQNYQFQVEEGSTATAWTPYENICPISGWEGCNLRHTGDGKNLLISDATGSGNYTITSTGGRTTNPSRLSSDYIPCVSGQTYVVSGIVGANTKSNVFSFAGIAFYDSDKIFISRTAINNANTLTATAPSNAVFMRFFEEATKATSELGGTLTTAYYATYKRQIEAGSTATTYSPYNGTTLPISWQTEAGTVYGGKLDVLSGVLTIDKIGVDLSAQTWSVKATGTTQKSVYTQLPEPYVGHPRTSKNVFNPILERYTKSGTGYYSGASDAKITNPDAQAIGYLFYSNSSQTRASTLYLIIDVDSTPSGMIVYNTANVTEVQLEPHEVKSLLGANNIFADTGNTSVEYCADTEMYIEKVKPVVNVDDVQINGTSIVSDGVANIPIASSNTLGAVKVATTISNGLYINSSGELLVYGAPTSIVKGGTDDKMPIMSKNIHAAAFYGLARASGDTTQSQSSNTLGDYTDNAKDKIQTMLGVSPLIASHESDPFESAHVIGELFIINGKLYRAKTTLMAGEYINEGTNVEVVDVAKVLDDKVDDVQINGTSIVSNGVGNIPYGSNDNYGVLKASSTNGIFAYGGVLSINNASESDIKGGEEELKPLTPNREHMAVFYGLTKAAGVDMSTSSNVVGAYTDEAKTAIKQMLGVHDVYDSFVEEITGTDVTITGQPSYRYNCGELYSLTVTPPSSGTIDFRFTSGSTPTVLTLPQTVKMPEWWVEVEANTIYEMCITDGVYCGVMSWAI